MLQNWCLQAQLKFETGFCLLSKHDNLNMIEVNTNNKLCHKERAQELLEKIQPNHSTLKIFFSFPFLKLWCQNIFDN